MDYLFDHEKLKVYQSAINFVSQSTDLLNSIPKSCSAHDQLDRASTSIPLNIAEGNGKWTPRDRCRFFDNARGSALECAAALDVAVSKKFIEPHLAFSAKKELVEIVRMLIGLIKANDPERAFGRSDVVREDSEIEYVTNRDLREQDQE